MDERDDDDIEYSGILTPSQRAYLLGDSYTGEKRTKANNPNESYERKLKNDILHRVEQFHQDLALLEQSDRFGGDLAKAFGPADHTKRNAIQEQAGPPADEFPAISNAVMAQTTAYGQDFARDALTNPDDLDYQEIADAFQASGASKKEIKRKVRQIAPQEAEKFAEGIDKALE